MRSGDTIELRDEVHERHLLTVQAHRQPLLEAYGDVLRLIWRLLKGGGEGKDIFGWLVVRVFQGSGFYRASEEVLVHAVGGLLGDGNGDTVLLGVSYLLGAAHIPVAHRRNDRKIRCYRSRGDVEADLIVALACGSMRDVGRPDLARDLDELLCD